MAAITDGTFTSAVQDGDKQVTFPYDFLGDSYARLITRPYVMLSSSYSAPRTLTTTSVTNYILRSESLANASWTKTNVTSTDNGYFNPHNGALTANVNYETVTAAEHSVSQAYTATNVSHVFSIYARADGRDYIRLKFTDSGATSYTCFFNLANGTVGTSSNMTGTITSVGNSYYRCSGVFTPAAGAGTVYINFSTDGSTVSYAGDITKGVLMWGAQMERASSAGTYLPTTSATRTTALRSRDVVDNSGDSTADQFAFLVQESAPDAGSLQNGISRFARTYARVPAQQVDYGSALIDRPVMHDITSGGYYAVSFDSGVTSHIFSSRNTVSAVTAMTANTQTVAAALPPYPLTLTATAGTTSTFNANASASAIQTQLNTDLPTCGTFTVTNPAFNKLNIVWTNAGTMSVVTTCANVATSVTSTTALFTCTGSSTFPACVYIKFGSAHGATAGDGVAVWNGSRLAGYGTIVSVADTTTICMRSADITSGDAFITHGTITAAATARYVNGPVNVSTKIITDSYYPGWSPGITTTTDIPIVSSQLDPVSWLGLIVANTAYGCIVSSNLEKWQGGPMYQQETTYCQMSDALETVAVGA